jgi:hypothetical protein
MKKDRLIAHPTPRVLLSIQPDFFPDEVQGRAQSSLASALRLAGLTLPPVQNDIIAASIIEVLCGGRAITFEIMSKGAASF